MYQTACSAPKKLAPALHSVVADRRLHLHATSLLRRVGRLLLHIEERADAPSTTLVSGVPQAD